MNKKVIVFAPHPDDETCGCGGTIAKRVSEGYDVRIVSMTDGSHAFSEVLGIDSEPTPNELKEIRKEEAKRAARILGVQDKNLLFLDFEDTMLEKNKTEAQAKVVEILRENPAPTEVYFPYEKDCNADHRVTNCIVRNAIKKLGIPTKEYRYTIERKYARVGPRKDALFNLFRHNMVRVDISKFLPTKEAALKEFTSMISIISSAQERPVMKNVAKYLKGEEVFYVDK
jgi:LmbE family N-acetylglucosaminyl deacetylase